MTHKCPKNTFNIVTDCDTKVFPFKCFCVSLPLHLSTVPKWRRCTGADSRRKAGRLRAADSRFHSAEVAAVGPGLTVRAPSRAPVSCVNRKFPPLHVRAAVRRTGRGGRKEEPLRANFLLFTVALGRFLRHRPALLRLATLPGNRKRH